MPLEGRGQEVEKGRAWGVWVIVDIDAARDEISAAMGAQAAGFDTDLWTLERVVQVIQRTTGVRLSRPSAWRLLTQRLGWSLQRPERQANAWRALAPAFDCWKYGRRSNDPDDQCKQYSRIEVKGQGLLEAGGCRMAHHNLQEAPSVRQGSRSEEDPAHHHHQQPGHGGRPRLAGNRGRRRLDR